MTKVAINGFGRIGRQTFRHLLERHPKVQVVAINDLTDTKTLAHLFKYDSNYGIFPGEVSSGDGLISVHGEEFRVFSEREPEKLPWKDLKVDVVLECTGIFRKKADAMRHVVAGAKKVVISAPADEKEIPSFILGVNEDLFDPETMEVIDMGSCTTNCLATTAKVLHDAFGIRKGFMTTAHSYTNDQRILDLPHKDLRRARAAALNIIPTSTGAAKAIGKVIPDIDGKLDGIALRVPTPVVSILDLVVEVEKPTSVELVNDAFKKAAEEKKFQGIFGVTDEPLVSMDFKGNTHSAIIDLQETMVKENLVKVLAWYDNEAGYSCRLAEFAEFVGKQL